MKKFNEWNEIKKKTENEKQNILPRKKEIWWIKMGINIGVEEDGKNENFERPVLVLKPFSDKSFVGIPLTSQNRAGQKYYFPLTYQSKTHYLILSQVRMFSSKRLLRILDKARREEFMEMKKILRKVLGI